MTLVFCKLRPSVTAEVAGSSPVVPAIHSKDVVRNWRKPQRVQKDINLCPFCALFTLIPAGYWVANHAAG